MADLPIPGDYPAMLDLCRRVAGKNRTVELDDVTGQIAVCGRGSPSYVGIYSTGNPPHWDSFVVYGDDTADGVEIKTADVLRWLIGRPHP